MHANIKLETYGKKLISIIVEPGPKVYTAEQGLTLIPFLAKY